MFMRRKRGCSSNAGPVTIADEGIVMFADRQKVVGAQTSGHWTGGSRFGRHVQIFLRSRFGGAQGLGRVASRTADVSSHGWGHRDSVGDAGLRLHLLDTSGDSEMRQTSRGSRRRFQRRSQPTGLLDGRDPRRFRPGGNLTFNRCRILDG